MSFDTPCWAAAFSSFSSFSSFCFCSWRAVLDVWPSGCWHYPNATCGEPLGRSNFPGEPDLATLPNVLPLRGGFMRNGRFWQASAEGVATNLDALALGRPLRWVVRHASGEGSTFAWGGTWGRPSWGLSPCEI